MITTRRAHLEDLGEMLRAERNSTDNLYLEAVHEEFFADEVGEMIVAEDDGVICGFGKITFQPDGCAWLEALRVDKNYQNKGAAKAIWKRFLEVAAVRQPKYIRMYTGTKNKTSSHIAELNGVNRTYEYSECVAALPSGKGEKGNFKAADAEFVISKLPEIRKEWGSYVCFNRTFYSLDKDTVEMLCKGGKVFTDGESIVAVGTRFMPERGNNLIFMMGDMDKCIKFALYFAEQNHDAKLTLMHRAVDKKVRNLVESMEFKYLPSNFIMVEGDFA